MSSALDWLNKATATLSETKKDGAEWEAKKRETELALDMFKRPTSLSEIDNKLLENSKNIELDKLPSASKARAQAALETLNEDGRGQLAMDVRLSGKLKPAGGKLGRIANKRPGPGDAASDREVGVEVKGAKGKVHGGRAKKKFGGSSKKRKKIDAPALRQKNQATSSTLTTTVPKITAVASAHAAHKSTTNLDGVYHAIEIIQTNNHVVFKATDQDTNDVYETKTKVKATVLTGKTIKEKEFFYENLIKRLAFKKEAGGVDTMLSGPRFMQQTGATGKKRLVFLKVSEHNASSVGVNNCKGELWPCVQFCKYLLLAP